jgi:glutathione S-transferase
MVATYLTNAFRARSSLQVRFLMEEKEIKYDLKSINLLLCHNLKPDYVKKVNPGGTVPSLVLPDGKVLAESLDIMK